MSRSHDHLITSESTRASSRTLTCPSRCPGLPQHCSSLRPAAAGRAERSSSSPIALSASPRQPHAWPSPCTLVGPAEWWRLCELLRTAGLIRELAGESQASSISVAQWSTMNGTVDGPGSPRSDGLDSDPSSDTLPVSPGKGRQYDPEHAKSLHGDTARPRAAMQHADGCVPIWSWLAPPGVSLASAEAHWPLRLALLPASCLAQGLPSNS